MPGQVDENQSLIHVGRYRIVTMGHRPVDRRCIRSEPKGVVDLAAVGRKLFLLIIESGPLEDDLEGLSGNSGEYEHPFTVGGRDTAKLGWLAAWRRRLIHGHLHTSKWLSLQVADMARDRAKVENWSRGRFLGHIPHVPVCCFLGRGPRRTDDALLNLGFRFHRGLGCRHRSLPHVQILGTG